jgi:hypothetical protein
MTGKTVTRSVTKPARISSIGLWLSGDFRVGGPCPATYQHRDEEGNEVLEGKQGPITVEFRGHVAKEGDQDSATGQALDRTGWVFDKVFNPGHHR